VIRALLALSTLAVADVLNTASRHIARVVGGRAWDSVEVHFAPWRITEGRIVGMYSLHLADLPRAADDPPLVRVVHAPSRFGRVVIVCDWSPDGGGTTYILDARDEYNYDPSEVPL
jgi:hypothetical protein